MKKRILYILPVVVWLVVMFAFSGQSGEDSAVLSLGLAQRLLDLMPFIRVDLMTLNGILRKLAHFGIFVIAGALIYPAVYGLKPDVKRGWLWAGVICVLIAIANELHQLFSLERSCSVKDMALDSAGAFVGIAAAYIAARLYRKLDRRRKL